MRHSGDDAWVSGMMSVRHGPSFRERKDMREAGRVGADVFWLVSTPSHPPGSAAPGSSFCVTPSQPLSLKEWGSYFLSTGKKLPFWHRTLDPMCPSGQPGETIQGLKVTVPLSQPAGVVHLHMFQNQHGAWVDLGTIGAIKVTRGAFAVPARRVGVTRRAKLSRRRRRLGRPGRKRRSR